MPRPMAGNSPCLSLSPRALPHPPSQPDLPPRILSKPPHLTLPLLQLLISRSPPLHRKQLPLLLSANLVPPLMRLSTDLALLPTALCWLRKAPLPSAPLLRDPSKSTVQQVRLGLLPLCMSLLCQTWSVPLSMLLLCHCCLLVTTFLG